MSCTDSSVFSKSPFVVTYILVFEARSVNPPASEMAFLKVNPGWTRTSWAELLRYLADGCADKQPELSVGYRAWAARLGEGAAGLEPAGLFDAAAADPIGSAADADDRSPLSSAESSAGPGQREAPRSARAQELTG